LAKRGLRIGFFDWELAGEDHRERLEKLFGNQMPSIRYIRCERPLAYEVDRLRRICAEDRLDFGIFDSVAFACDGPPESAEAASKYFRALRQIGIGGSLHIAHVTKSADGKENDSKPFGSVFWYNGARKLWFVRKVEETPDQLKLGFFFRKANIGRSHRDAGLDMTFSDDRVVVKRSVIAATPELAAHLSIKERMDHLLGRTPMTPAELAEELGIKVDTIQKTYRRHPARFTVIEGGRYALRAHNQ